jgi:hypothetical protein
MTFALTSIVSCEVLGLSTPFVGTCWGAMQCPGVANMP